MVQAPDKITGTAEEEFDLAKLVISFSFNDFFIILGNMIV